VWCVSELATHGTVEWGKEVHCFSLIIPCSLCFVTFRVSEFLRFTNKGGDQISKSHNMMLGVNSFWLARAPDCSGEGSFGKTSGLREIEHSERVGERSSQ